MEEVNIISRICQILVNFDTKNFLKVKSFILPYDKSFNFLSYVEKLLKRFKKAKLIFLFVLLQICCVLFIFFNHDISLPLHNLDAF